MLSKCANPSCSTPLIYLREGKIFMMDYSPQQQNHFLGATQINAGSRVEHFWLCGPCSAELTIAYDPGTGVAVVPKTRVHRAAA